jgi:hypothetical protein
VQIGKYRLLFLASPADAAPAHPHVVPDDNGPASGPLADGESGSGT